MPHEQLSPVLRKRREDLGGGYLYRCPGCKKAHAVTVGAGGWTFDGNVGAPTFRPSVKIKVDEPDPFDSTKSTEHVLCHHTIEMGMLNFRPSEAHNLRGLVPMVTFED